MSANNSMFKSIGFYGSATMIRGLASFIMLPIYTSVLSPADYGLIELLGLILDLTTLIIGAKFSAGVMRYYLLAPNEKEKGRVIFSALSLGLLVNVVGISLLWLLASKISVLTFGTHEYILYIQIYSLTLLTSVFSDISFFALRAMERAKQYFLFSVFKLILQISFNVLFIIIYDYGVLGVIYAAVCSGFLISISLLIYIKLFHEFGISIDIMKSLIGFSVPIIFASMLEFYVVFGDRYFINYFSGVAEVGIYSLAYKFGFLLLMVSFGPFYAAWEPRAYKVVKENKPLIFFQNNFLISMFILISFATLIASFSFEIIKIVTSSSAFWPASTLIPPIILAYTLQGLDGYCKFGIFVTGNTKHHFYAVLASTIIATIGYLVLIPRYGALGAAWTTVGAIGVKALWQYFAGKHFFDMELKWRPIISLFAISILTVLICNHWDIENIFLAIILKSFVMLVYLFAIWNFTFLERMQKDAVTSWLGNKYNAFRG